ncbi:MAG: rRNA (cytosine967-C5)-methyltransferase [Acidobacteriota bacterium]|jgi:16S rRNA (cytosine967-C5)-methyltransferase|nr:rRNA (cytosine967-C5)-methyltransferase [Acidobacteriota bacterium]
MTAPGGKATRIVSPARRAAFAILRRVEEDDAYAVPLLAAADSGIRADDRALCYELVLGTLRWQLWLDALIEHYAGRAAASLDPPVRRALRLGLYQLRFLSRIPASAAVNDSVNLAHISKMRSAAAFINAVLRRAVREPEIDPAAEIRDPIHRLEIETSHPGWLLERWIAAFGRREAEEFARSNNHAPPVAFRVTASGKAEEILNALRAQGGELETSRLIPDAWRIRGASARMHQLAGEAKIYVQDEASQLVAHVLGARAGDRVLDVCAAPGSKTTHIAALAPGLALLVAGEVHENRARILAEAATGGNADQFNVVIHDAEAGLPYTNALFDRVLVDAPCSGTGTLRRNPEIRWRISEEDIFDLSARQQRILIASAQMVKRGGRLVYSTCSVETEENERVVESFLRETPDFRPAPLNLPHGPRDDAATVRTWPQQEGTDGFFIASFERSS